MNIKRTYTFNDGSKISMSQVETEFDTITSTWNNHDSGSSYWNRTYTYGPLRVGLAAVTGSSAVAAVTTGATLAAGTYYYKIFAFPTNNLVGIPSPEMEVVVGGANNSVNVSWTAVLGASYYRVQRDITSGGGVGGGYFLTTSTSFADIGQAYTASGGAVTAGTNSLAYFSGTMYLPAGIGSINWYNWNDGEVSGHVGITSAGEYEMSTGKGDGQGVYFFENQDTQIRIKFYTDTITPQIHFTNTSANLDAKIAALSLEFNAGVDPGVDILLLEETLITSRVDIKLTSSDLIIDTAGNTLKIKEGSNAKMGVSTLVGGTVTVSTTAVTSNSRIFLTGQNSSGTHGELTVSARTASTSFTITSSSGTDTRDIAWVILDPS